MSRCTFN